MTVKAMISERVSVRIVVSVCLSPVRRLRRFVADRFRTSKFQEVCALAGKWFRRAGQLFRRTRFDETKPDRGTSFAAAGGSLETPKS